MTSGLDQAAQSTILSGGFDEVSDLSGGKIGAGQQFRPILGESAIVRIQDRSQTEAFKGTA